MKDKMASVKAALGFFTYVDDTCDALHKLDEAGFEGMITYSPIPSHDIEHVLKEIRPKFSWSWGNIIQAAKTRNFHIARFTLFGAIWGFSFAQLLVIGSALLWPVNQGGLPHISLPVVALLTYELTTIHGIIFTVIGFFVLAKLPAYKKNEICDEAFNDNKFGIALKYSNQGQFDHISSIMMDCHAEKVEPREGSLRI